MAAAAELPDEPEEALPAPPGAGEASAEAAAPAPAQSPPVVPAKEALRAHDFRQPACLAAPELRKLRIWHEEFVRALAARLSMYLRLEVTLQISKLQTIVFQKFVESLPEPTYLTLFKVEPLRGICLLDIPPRLGLTFVDRMLGGPAQTANLQRDLSEIEHALLEQVVQNVLGEWCSHWTPPPELKPILLGHETSGRFLQTTTRDTILFTLEIEARIGDCIEHLRLGFPHYTLEPLVSRLTAPPGAGGKAPALAAPRPQWNHHLDDVKVPVTAEWLGLEITLRDIAQLKVGDVIQVPPQSVSQVQLHLAGQPKFVGRLGTRGNQWAIETTHALHA